MTLPPPSVDLISGYMHRIYAVAKDGGGRRNYTATRKSSVVANRAPLAAGRLNYAHVTIDGRVVSLRQPQTVSLVSEDLLS